MIFDIRSTAIQSAIQKIIPRWQERFAHHLSIAKKIGYGYGLAISIAVSGTTIGLIVGDRSQRQAQEQLKVAEIQQEIIDQLTIVTLSVQMHPQRLISVLEDSIWFRYETSRFINDVNEVNSTLIELESFVNNHPTQLATEPQQIHQLIQGYTQAIAEDAEFIRSLWQQIDPAELQSQNLAQSQQRILLALTEAEMGQLRLSFDRLSENLIRMKQAAVQQQSQAYTQLDRAQTFRLHIIIFSMVLSTAIAILLAIITSRAIARPVQTLTQVAQQSIRQSNFDLQAPVISHDEIGALSNAFNQLIASVKQLLEQQQTTNEKLELYNHTLEQKVTERTHELSEKNTHLNRLLEELRRTQTQMVQSEKMSSLGQLVAGVAHEINNPVNFIHGNIMHVNEYTQELLGLIEAYQQHYPDTPPALQDRLETIDLDFVVEDLPKVLRSMKVGTDRIREIVLSLRNFSRLDESEFKSVDIHEGIDNTLLILWHRLKAKAESPEIQVIKDYGELPHVECYPGQLNQVFMNLLANAIDALEESNQSRSFQEIVANPSVIQIQTQHLNTDRVLITIADNGDGIPETVRARLFDPFFTTKPVGKGTGLGLSISYQIVVEKHKGRMYCNSVPGQGTLFAIEIPVRQSLSMADDAIDEVDETAIFF